MVRVPREIVVIAAIFVVWLAIAWLVYILHLPLIVTMAAVILMLIVAVAI